MSISQITTFGVLVIILLIYVGVCLIRRKEMSARVAGRIATACGTFVSIIVLLGLVILPAILNAEQEKELLPVLLKESSPALGAAIVLLFIPEFNRFIKWLKRKKPSATKPRTEIGIGATGDRQERTEREDRHD